ncbi:MAG: tetratricopeptide repeat protein, partial [Myxococcota bacterium]|nr:tetratricopeptide repeat protein [Myxococcota bacterium]
MAWVKLLMSGFLALAMSLAIRPAHALDESSMQALRQGDCRPALVDGSTDTPAQALARARCLVSTDRLDAALDALRPLSGGSLSGYAGLVAAEALLAHGEPERAAARLAGVSLPGPAGRRAARGRGRAMIEIGRYLDGRDALRPLLEGAAGKAGRLGTPGGADPAEARWWLAEGAARRGATAAAIPVWQTLWARNPTSPRAAQAAARLSAVGHPVPDPSRPAGRDLIRVRIQSLETLQGWAEALALRDLMPPDDQTRTTAALARASFRAKDYQRAVRLYSSMAARSPRQAFDLALGASRTGDYDLAAQHYTRLIADHPGHALAIHADFKLAYLAYDSGDLARAIALFEGHLGRHPGTRRQDEARWFIGWAQYRLGRHEEANESFQRLLETTPGSSMASGARYWQARIAAARGDAAGAAAGYAEVLRRWPRSGHAWFAAWRLGRAYPTPTDEPPPAPPASLDVPAFHD